MVATAYLQLFQHKQAVAHDISAVDFVTTQTKRLEKQTEGLVGIASCTLAQGTHGGRKDGAQCLFCPRVCLAALVYTKPH